MLLRLLYFVKDLNDFAAVNEVYGDITLNENPPARSCFQVAKLPMDAPIEIEVVAVINK